MSDPKDDDISLRYYLEFRIAALEKKLEAEFASRARAVELQHQEYMRRLIDLNHAHDRQNVVQETYLPREMFEASQREFRVWHDSVNNTLSLNAGRTAAYGGLVFLVSIAVSAALHFIK